MRALLVDDEPALLDALQRSLRRLRRGWGVCVAPGAQRALAMMDADRFDAVVTDMRMPSMDGAELLRACQERDVIRFVLSGQTALEGALRSVSSAHRFLSKPSSVDALVAALEEAHTALAPVDAAARARLAAIACLPCGAEAQASVSMLLSRGAALDVVAGAIASDVGMSAKVLQLVNSSYFGGGASIACPREGAARIGVALLEAMNAAGVFPVGPLGRGPGPGERLVDAASDILSPIGARLGPALFGLWGIPH